MAKEKYISATERLFFGFVVVVVLGFFPFASFVVKGKFLRRLLIEVLKAHIA